MREGKRLSQPLAEEIQQIIYAPRLASERNHIFEYLVAVNLAHLAMLAETNILAPDAATVIARAILEMEAAGPDAVEWDPGREDAYYNFEARLVELTGIRTGGQIHAGRSRNDIGATIDRMRARDWCLELGSRLCRLQDALLERAEQHRATVMSGYTHLQPAQPITYGFYLLGIAQALQRDGERLRAAFAAADQCPLGAGALAGTAFPIDRDRSAELLGFSSLLEHAQDAVASRDFLIDAVNACISMALTWSRFAQDIYVWSTREFALVRLPDRIAGTSSIMPQKKNPVVLEYLKAKTAHAIGQLVGMLASVSSTHFTMTIDGCKAATATAWTLLQDASDCLVLTRLVVEEAVPQSDRMMAEAAANFSTMTDLTDALVTDHGLSFREAHHVVGSAVAQLIGEGLPADALTSGHVDAASSAVIGRGLGASEEWLNDKLDPLRAVRARSSRGGTSPVEVARMIAIARAASQRQREQIDASRRAIADAGTQLRRVAVGLGNRGH